MAQSQPKLSKNSSDTKYELSAVFFNKNIELKICTFYGKVLKSLYAVYGQKLSEIRCSLEIRKSCKDPEAKNPVTPSFENDYDRLAYIFDHAAIHSSVIYYSFSGILNANRSLLERIHSMEEIGLCILGGGPALEFVPVCKLLNSVTAMRNRMGRPPLQVHVTLVDKCISWKQDAEIIISTAENNLYDARNMQIHYSFLEADLTTEFPEDVKRALKSSHFVTVFKCLTENDYAYYSRPEIPGLMHRIVDSMSIKACLFFLDTSGGGYFNNMNKVINELPHTERIYGPYLHYRHALNAKSERSLQNALCYTFPGFRFATQSTSSFTAWTKTRDIIKMRKLHFKTLKTPGDTAGASEEPKPEKKKCKTRMKRNLQSHAKLRQLYW